MRRTSRAVVIKDNQLLVMSRNKFGHKYTAIVGGEIESGEDEIQALHREVLEESGITIANPRLIIEEDAGPMFGIQYIYLCDYVSGEPMLHPDSPESKITALGKNLYQPGWLPVSELKDSNLLPTQLRDLLVDFLNNGFPKDPVKLKIQD